MFPSKLLLGNDMFTLTYVVLEYENSITIWGFEKMIVLKKIVLPSLKLATRINSQNSNGSEFFNGLWQIKFNEIWCFQLT